MRAVTLAGARSLRRVTTFSHAGNVDIASDWLGDVKVEHDALGRVTKAADKKGFATLTAYRPFGGERTVLSPGARSSPSPTLTAGVLRHLDPDRSETLVRYDGFGQPRTMDDAERARGWLEPDHVDL